MSEYIDLNRRRLLGATAIAITAAQLGISREEKLHLAVEGEVPSLGGATEWPQFTAVDDGRTTRESHPDRFLDLYLHQPDAHPSVYSRVGSEIQTTGVARNRRSIS